MKRLVLSVILLFCFLSCNHQKEFQLYKYLEDNISDREALLNFKESDFPSSEITRILHSNAYQQIFVDSLLKKDLLIFCDQYLTQRKFCSDLFLHSFHAYLNNYKLDLDTIETHFIKVIEQGSLWGLRTDYEFEQMMKVNDKILEIGSLFEMVFPYEYQSDGSKEYVSYGYPFSLDIIEQDSVVIKCKLLDKYYYKPGKRIEDKFMKFKILESSENEIFVKNDIIDRPISFYKRPIKVLE